MMESSTSCNIHHLCSCTSSRCRHIKLSHNNNKAHQDQNKKNLSAVKCSLIVGAILVSTFVAVCLAADNQPVSQPISSRAAYLRARAARLQQQLNQQQSSTSPAPSQTSPPTQPSQATTSSQQNSATSSSTSQPKSSSTTTSSTTTSTTTTTTTTTRKPRLAEAHKLVQVVDVRTFPDVGIASAPVANRTTRTTADVEDFNIFVTNTCERELMHVNIKTSKPFYGVIHTRNQRQKSICTIEGTGEIEYNLEINHVLNQQDPNYCGVIRARKESPKDKDLLSVVIVVRLHKNIELSNDKFFLLNCTDRCRRADCLPPSSARVVAESPTEGVEHEGVALPPPSRPPTAGNTSRRETHQDECTIYNFPWVITLFWCLGILLLASIISHCIMCSSFFCRCVKTEVEEREPSVYEDETEDVYSKKNHPMRIDYDNRDIYKTSNNYEPYNMYNSCDDDDDNDPKMRHSSSKKTGRRYR